MTNLLEIKSDRANYYRIKIQEMDQVINNYSDYTFSELKEMRDKFFKNFGYLK